MTKSAREHSSIDTSLLARRVRVLGGAAVFAVLAACASSEPLAIDTSVPPSPEVLAQGAYVARVANCLTCHTAPGGAPFAGGRAIATEFGVFYSPNITPDSATGIGAWTEQKFVRAVRRGIRPDGAPLYPLMPTESYAHMSDEDAHALWSYLQSVPAVENAVPDHEISFPLNLRQTIRLWRTLYFEPTPYAPSSGKSASWNRGAYLVEGIAHCAACHTPRNGMGALDEERRYAGGDVEGWRAPDIGGGPSSRVAAWSEEDLALFLRTGEIDGVAVEGPMAEVVRDGLSHLTEADAAAIAAYLKDLPSASPAPRDKAQPTDWAAR